MRCVGIAVFVTGLLLSNLTIAREYKFESNFDPASMQWSKQIGNASVEGMGIYRTASGEMKTCAGQTILYYPYASYTVEYLRAQIQGYDQFDNLDRRIKDYRFAVQCNSDGQFVINHLPAGKWIFVMSIPIVNNEDGKSSYNLASDMSQVAGEGYGTLYRVITVNPAQKAQVSLIQNDEFAH